MVCGPQLRRGHGLGLFLPRQNFPMRKNCSWFNVFKASFSHKLHLAVGGLGGKVKRD